MNSLFTPFFPLLLVVGCMALAMLLARLAEILDLSGRWRRWQARRRHRASVAAARRVFRAGLLIIALSVAGMASGRDRYTTLVDAPYRPDLPATYLTPDEVPGHMARLYSELPTDVQMGLLFVSGVLFLIAGVVIYKRGAKVGEERALRGFVKHRMKSLQLADAFRPEFSDAAQHVPTDPSSYKRQREEMFNAFASATSTQEAP